MLPDVAKSFWVYCGVEQSVARRVHIPKVGGSNPSPATKVYQHHTRGKVILIYLWHSKMKSAIDTLTSVDTDGRYSSQTLSSSVVFL